MNITLADHYGMCFGVRDALKATRSAAAAGPVTVLGELVHNPVVQQQLSDLGVQRGDLHAPAGSGHVVITAHGASDHDRAAWAAGHQVTDTTCPLVRKAHSALATLVKQGCTPVVIGQALHVEVRGLTGDFPDAIVIETEADIPRIPAAARIGIVSQTTQPIQKVRALVDAVRAARPGAEIVFRDTVCQPTKDRQAAIEKLCRENDTVIIVGGRHSNNTRQLVLTARQLGAEAWQVETAADLEPAWLQRAENVGLTAGTSTLEETVQEVWQRLREIAREHTP
jgi:4-hydroxy-3-methylbut-2-en-1-yl diphosphate reductase